MSPSAEGLARQYGRILARLLAWRGNEALNDLGLVLVERCIEAAARECEDAGLHVRRPRPR